MKRLLWAPRGAGWVTASREAAVRGEGTPTGGRGDLRGGKGLEGGLRKRRRPFEAISYAALPSIHLPPPLVDRDRTSRLQLTCVSPLPPRHANALVSYSPGSVGSAESPFNTGQTRVSPGLPSWLPLLLDPGSTLVPDARGSPRPTLHIASRPGEIPVCLVEVRGRKEREGHMRFGRSYLKGLGGLHIHLIPGTCTPLLSHDPLLTKPTLWCTLFLARARITVCVIEPIKNPGRPRSTGARLTVAAVSRRRGLTSSFLWVEAAIFVVRSGQE
ncbi:hypothetical protein DPEC_G00268470 [Dallia pectoralis]|uniref:Uncharacterized protein n=1 Tax=Dallia pectoralis TaxID=75939 RepID=A0ACC2FNW4_DALPE|nr:hypothetical protein DPEC_G00268470 [Dallia pectoralis]